VPLQTANWQPNKEMPVGKRATVQQFFTTVGKSRFEINVAPWGEGQLKVNGQEIARSIWLTRHESSASFDLLIVESQSVRGGSGGRFIYR
jgi:hypothetical protein